MLDTNNPPNLLFESLSAKRYTLSELALETEIANLPNSLGKPFSILNQLSPPSVDLYTPLPSPPEITFQGSL